MNEFINRELSWLDFNKRVLHLANKQSIPIAERMKYLGITASNLDEFIRVRLSYLMNRTFDNTDTKLDISGLTSVEEYRLIKDYLLKFIAMQHETYTNLIKELKDSNITLYKYDDLHGKERDSADNIFEKNIFPLLTVISYDTTKDFPLIKSGQLNIITHIKDHNSDIICITPLDSSLKRIYRIDTEDKSNKYILLEDLVMGCGNRIFVNKEIEFQGVIRLLREADIELEHDRDVYIVDRIKNVVMKREWSKPIFLEISDDIPRSIEKLLRKEFDLKRTFIYRTDFPLDMSFLKEKFIRQHGMEFEKFVPQYPEELLGESDIFSAMDDSDFLLHHPYDSFDGFISLLEQASVDKEVLSIKQTLYRVSSDESPIIDALCQASENGKQVAVLLELKARFDEEQNISLIDKLKHSGCKLIYGMEDWKTHCKFTLIIKQVKKSLKVYSHVSTGNYNETTAKSYTDLGYFTTSPKIGSDLLNLFNLLSGWSELKELNKISVSPFNYREKLYSLIDREIENAKKGMHASIIFKINSLSDVALISKLYEASRFGVQVRIICRGICSMQKINNNIIIKSVIGRFLEHSRIYYFSNSNDIRVFISSADLLTRNLDRRIELFMPIVSTKLRVKLEHILSAYMEDTANSFYLSEDGEWLTVKNDTKFDVQQYFMTLASNRNKFKSMPKMALKK